MYQQKRRGDGLLMLVDCFLLKARLDAVGGDHSQRLRVEVEEVGGIVGKSKKMLTQEQTAAVGAAAEDSLSYTGRKSRGYRQALPGGRKTLRKLSK